MKQILLKHIKKYPKMQLTDLVKLIYQNEFGGGHLIKDSNVSLAYLKKEYCQLKQDESIDLYEEIGNGIVRVNLAALDKNNLSLERLNELFVKSANEHKGNVENFERKLQILEKLIEEKKVSISKEEYTNYINEYKKLNYPAVSHSEIYREYYHPSYRIILLKHLKDGEHENI